MKVVIMTLLAVGEWGAKGGPLRAGAARVEVASSTDWGLTNAWNAEAGIVGGVVGMMRQ